MIDYLVFVIDDEEIIRDQIALALRKRHRIETFPDAESGIEALKEQTPDLVLLDIGLPGMGGIETLHVLKDRYPDMLVMMITAYNEVDLVVSAMKGGACDYVLKPLHMGTLKAKIRSVLETIKLKKEIRLLQDKYLKENIPFFIGESENIVDVMDTVEKISQSADTPVLIYGETGTGKELIARIIHHRSPNSSHPLVTMNCATIPNELIESEMFGYVKGAFSGADEAGKTGLVEEANGGTLFLDEVGDLSAQAQSKLLRFLESGEYYRVGGTEKRSVKTRIISATNRNIESMIEKGAFRRDLFFRLAVVKLEIPSLNRRKRDILPIATYFLTQFSEKLKKNITGFTKNAEKLLLGHHWKGNIRELRNLVERAVLVAEGSQISIKDLDLKEIIDCDLPPEGLESEINLPPLSPEGIDFQRFMQYIEKYYFTYALKLSGGNETKAAQLLGLTRDAFRYRRKKMNLEEKE